MTDDELRAQGVSRRDFIKKMVAVGFAVPIVSSFTLDAVASANPKHMPPNQTYSNQTYPHPRPPTLPNQFHFPNQSYFPNQFFPNQFHFHFPNSSAPI